MVARAIPSPEEPAVRKSEALQCARARFFDLKPSRRPCQVILASDLAERFGYQARIYPQLPAATIGELHPRVQSGGALTASPRLAWLRPLRLAGKGEHRQVVVSPVALDSIFTFLFPSPYPTNPTDHFHYPTDPQSVFTREQIELAAATAASAAAERYLQLGVPRERVRIVATEAELAHAAAALAAADAIGVDAEWCGNRRAGSGCA